ncbi:MAG: tetratricopeptide repeat protein [candidate division Zixibacteria bacterium]|nr:tetratricopeptide repeat protein [candidate division Zixibacteria bacterium]
MKNKKLRIILMISISVISGVLLTSVFSEAVDKPQVRIWVEKDQFFVYEPILVYYEIKNESDSILYLSSYNELTEHFVITDTQGKRYNSHLRGTSMGVDHLKPGETRHGSVDICGLYGIVSIGEYSCYLDIAPPAQFYHPQYERTKSNTIKIKVIEPDGDEKKALNLYSEADKLSWARSKGGGPDPTKKELGFLKYQELVDKYPNSVYAPIALRSAIFVYVYSPEFRKKVFPVCLRLIEDYPNSYYWASGFSHLVGTYEVLKDKDSAIKTMNELIEKHPNTKISERAAYWLKQIEKWEFK